MPNLRFRLLPIRGRKWAPGVDFHRSCAPIGKEQKRLRFNVLSGKCCRALVTIMRW
jgi:hypothetical protein